MISKYFKPYETECNCGCGINNVRQTSIARLDRARGIADMPFIINSACRCPKHNEDEEGSETSSHLATEVKESYAFDIAVGSSHARFAILKALIEAGFTRIGIYKTFIHADDDETKPAEVSWVKG